MTIRLPTGVVNAVADLIAARVDAGPGAGTMEIRSGAQPANANGAATGTLLATVTLADPSFAAAVAGAIVLDATPVLTVVATGTGAPGWFRIADSTGAVVMDGSAGIAATDLILDNAAISTGDTVNITAGTVTEPAG